MEKKNVLVRLEPEIEMALRELDPKKKMSLSRALEHIYFVMRLMKRIRRRRNNLE